MSRRPKTRKNEPVRLIGYIRVSTEEQAEEGVSLDAQTARLEAYALAHGFELVGVEVDAGVSGKVLPSKRVGLSRALSAVGSGRAEGIVALKLDRLSRSTRDVLDLADDANRNGWRLCSVSEQLDTGSPTGRFTLTILAALAQLEREQTAERVTDALAHISRKGRAASRFTPFGYSLADGSTECVGAGNKPELVPNITEQKVLSTIRRMRSEGFGARRITGALNAQGSTNPRTGNPWNRGTIESIVGTAERRERLGISGA